jgi:excisionase family DNA binding protein
MSEEKHDEAAGGDSSANNRVKEQATALRVVRPQVEKLSIRFSVPALCTIDEAAEILTLSKRTVATLISDGKLKTVPLGRRRIVSRAALEKLTGTKLS